MMICGKPNAFVDAFSMTLMGLLHGEPGKYFNYSRPTSSVPEKPQKKSAASLSQHDMPSRPSHNVKHVAGDGT